MRSVFVLTIALFSFLASALPAAEPPPAVIAAGVKHDAWDALVKKYVDDRGLVAYGAWKASAEDRKALDEYLGQFSAKPARAAEGDELIASTINAYNAFAIRWIISNYPTDSIQALPGSFTEKRHDVGGEKVSLDQLEHGTLRPKIGWRAHSALVCCARSCPPLQRFAYRPAEVQKQIDAAYVAWLGRSDLNRFMSGEKKAEVSSVFKWFADDFKKDGGLGPILSRFAPEPARAFLGAGDVKFSYLTYHWGLNDQGGQGKDYSRADLIWDKVTGTFK